PSSCATTRSGSASSSPSASSSRSPRSTRPSAGSTATSPASSRPSGRSPRMGVSPTSAPSPPTSSAGRTATSPTPPSPSSSPLSLPPPAYGQVLPPPWAVPAAAGAPGYQILAVELPPGMPFDKPRADTGWQASPQARIERLLRETGVPIGILYNADALRLVYA